MICWAWFTKSRVNPLLVHRKWVGVCWNSIHFSEALWEATPLLRQTNGWIREGWTRSRCSWSCTLRVEPTLNCPAYPTSRSILSIMKTVTWPEHDPTNFLSFKECIIGTNINMKMKPKGYRHWPEACFRPPFYFVADSTCLVTNQKFVLFKTFSEGATCRRFLTLS